MLIRLGYAVELEVQQTTPLYMLMGIHPDDGRKVRWSRPQAGEPRPGAHLFRDWFGNVGQRLTAEPGVTSLRFDAIVEDDGALDPCEPAAVQVSPDRLPDECLGYLLPSRYCESDRLASLAWKLFGHIPGGWAMVQAVCDYVNFRLSFSYGFARCSRTAVEAHEERVGVCRDFAHLAIAFCRALNIPARYVNGYMGDIGVEPDPAPMDFNAWFEAYLGGRWYTFDPRHNMRRMGRVVVARGRDAADVPLLHTFGPHHLRKFEVWTHEHSGALPVDMATGERERERAVVGRYGPPGHSPLDLGQSDDSRYLL